MKKPAIKRTRPSTKPVKAKTTDLVAAEAILAKKYKHIVAGTLRLDACGKRSVEAKLECGCVARVFTSDLFQVKTCAACRKAKDGERLNVLKAKRKTAKAEKKAAKVAEPKEPKAPEVTPRGMKAKALREKRASEKAGMVTRRKYTRKAINAGQSGLGEVEEAPVVEPVAPAETTPATEGW